MSNRGPLGKLTLAGICCCLLLAVTIPSFVRAQSPATSPTNNAPTEQPGSTTPPAFEVASIKPDDSGINNHFLQLPAPGRFRTINIPAKDIIEFAYNLKPAQLTGGPSWITSQGYEIDAKVADAEIPALPDQRLDQIKLMIRSLLTERFKLVMSHATKDMPIYALVVAKGGPKLTPTAYVEPDPNAPPPPMDQRQHLQIIPGKISAVNVPMSGLVEALATLPDLGGRVSGRVIQDRTGLKGYYDFEITFTQQVPVPGTPAASANSDTSAPSIFTALEEQVGLRLESTKAPLDVYTIEHIEEPTPN